MPRRSSGATRSFARSGVSGRGRAGPGGARAVRRGGNRQNGFVGSGHRRGNGAVGLVLSCRGIEAEAGLSFAGLSDLLSGVLAEVAEALLPLRRRALEVALLLAEPGEEPPDPRTIGVAVLDVLQLLAERGPVVAAVDDLQWLDLPSAGALQLALRRLRTGRVGFLATVREAPGVSVPFELDRSLSQARYVVSRLVPRDGGAPQAAQEPAWTGVAPTRARPRGRCDGRQPVLCAGARPRASRDTPSGSSRDGRYGFPGA